MESTTVSYSGTVHISSGGVANSTTVNKYGTVYISSGGVANSTTVNDYGKVHISSGGVANSTTVSGGGYVYISSGGVANSTTVDNWGSMHISGGVANSTTVRYNGSMHIVGGVANSTMVSSGGSVHISNGGVANDTTVTLGGNMHVSEGGIVTGKVEMTSGGSMTVYEGGIVRDATFYGNANTTIGGDGGIFERVNVASNGVIRTSNVTVTDLTVETRGAAYLSGGVATDLEVASKGILQLCEGTTASDITVLSGGHCYIGKDAVVTGEFSIAAGATVLAFTGSELNFSIAGRTAEDSALVDNLGAIRGRIGYSITLAEDQAAGVYRLADGVKSDSFTDFEVLYGELELEGLNLEQDIISNGMNFDLNVEDGSLYLELSVATEEDLLAYSSRFDGGYEGTATENLTAGTESDPLKNGLLA